MEIIHVTKIQPTCPECGGEEEVPCYECRGDNERVCRCEGNGCYECHNRGVVDCEDCDQDGKAVCRTCDPRGDQEYLCDENGNDIWIWLEEIREEETEKNETPVMVEA